MRLLLTATAYPPSVGGAQLHAHMLAQQLAERNGIQVVTHWDENRCDWLWGTTLRASNHSDDYVIDSIQVHKLGLAIHEKVWIAPWVLTYYPLQRIALHPLAQNLERHLDQYAQRADLVHHIRIGREPLAYASLGVARKYNVPFVLTPLHHPRWVGWRYRLFIELYGAADMVLALTSAEKQTLVRLGVSEHRIMVTGHGPVLAEHAHPERFLQEHRIQGPIVLFVGQHYEYKGYRQTLQSAPYVWKQVPDAHFVFIGPSVGQSDRVFRDISDRRVHRLGTVSLQEKTDSLAACTLLCVPSTQESFGGVYTEAWSFAKPVIGCNIPPVAEVIDDDINGFLVSQDPVQIAARICDLLMDPHRARVMGQNGRRKVERRYTWPRLAQLTEQAYCKALSGQSI